MKKHFYLAFLSAIALTGTLSFTSCSSADDLLAEEPQPQVEDSPNYNPKTGEVGVEFVMNVATGNGNTRMSSNNAQASLSSPFRGIDNAVLMTFSQKSGESLTDGKNLPAAATAVKKYDFGTVLSAGTLDPDGDGSSIPQSRRVLELSLPTETNTLLFWGKAIKSGTSTQQGSVTAVMNSDLSAISFTVDKRIPEGDAAGGETAFLQHQTFVATLLTKLVDSRSNFTVTYGGQTYTATNFGWKDYVTWNTTTNELEKKSTINWGDEDRPITPLGEILADAFIAMNTIYDGETRAGSGPAVATTLSDLYNVIYKVSSASPTSAGEALTKSLASSLQSMITSMVDPTTKKWVSNLDDLKSLSGLPANQTGLIQDLNDFPLESFKVPQGAAILIMTIDNKTSDTNRSFTYSYNNAIPSYAMNGDVNSTFDPRNYRYPVELCYFGNSPIRVTNDSHVTADYPDGTSNWDDDSNAKWTGWTKNSHVLSSTRSVAMQQNINYGTALLQTTVRYGASTLEDNNHAIQDARRGVNEPNRSITVSPGLFTLTGVLVGGVEPEVGWNYIEKAASPTYASYIYDNDLPSSAIPASGKSDPNYTMVWDNWNPGQKGQKQNVVYIALEFVNHAGDFWGAKNLIREGQTFYITGKLDPDAGHSTTDRSDGITWPTKYALPPYNADGSTIKERRIFIQDYKTVADFIIGTNSLQAALVDVPDLRASQISLGLSVDLEWQAGLNFESVTLGQ